MPLWTFSLRQLVQAALRVLVSVVVGTIGGLLGGVIGQKLFDLHVAVAVRGLRLGDHRALIGASLGIFDVLSRFVRQEDTRGALRKISPGPLAAPWAGCSGGFLSW